MKKYFTPIIFLFCYVAFKYFIARDFNILTDGTILCMFVIIIADATISRRRLLKIQNGLKQAIKTLRETTDKKILLKSLGSKELDAKLYQFRKDKKSSEYALSSIDISHYITEDDIAEISYRDITDLIAGAMTGLGIFGTFIGLSAGLQGFNTSDSNVIMSSITNLMDGIKVAFYTSIFGVAVSLIYNFFYKADIRNTTSLLYQFYDAFYEKWPPEDNFKNTLFELQSKQTAALEKLSKDIAGELATAMNNSVVPTMNELKNATFGYIEKAVETQSETLDKLVASFMVKLNNSLNNQFTALSNTIDEICRWQTEMTELCKTLGKTGEALQSTSDSVSGIEMNYRTVFEALQNSITTMSKYMSTLHTYQGDVFSTIEKLNKIVTQHDEAAARQLSAAERLSHYFESSDKYIENVEQTYKSGEKYLKTIQDVAGSFQQISHMQAVTITANIKAAEEYNNSVKLVKTCITNLNKINEQLNKEVSGEIQDRIYLKLSEEVEQQTSELRKIVKYQSDASKNLLLTAEKLQSPLRRLLSALTEGGNSASETETTKQSDNAQQNGGNKQ